MKFQGQSSKLKVLRVAQGWFCVGLALLLCGCASPRRASSGYTRPFQFPQDCFAYANELVWEYQVDLATGKMAHTRRQPPPGYTHHCFVVARAARQFFQHARFDSTQPVVDEAAYRRLIQRVLSRSPRTPAVEETRIVIPGYPNLREFSAARTRLLQEECGGAHQSYLQRGHWRMIFPLSRAHQERMAKQLAESLRHNRPPVVHLVRFPSLAINHAALLFDAQETGTEIRFSTYDPNQPDQPACLTYNRAQRRFLYPANDYFVGGRVDVYEIYHGWNY